jgi:capsular exopolysaccharide synthesis family protein
VKRSTAELYSRLKTERDDVIHLRYYVQIIQKRYHVVVFFFLTVVFTGVVFTYSQTPIYRSSTKILVEQSEPEIIIPNFSPTKINNPHFIYSQIELLKSKNVVEKIINNLKQDDIFLNSFNRKKTIISQTKDIIFSIFTSNTSVVVDQNKIYHKKINRIKSLLLQNIQVQLKGESNIIGISFMHQNPLVAQKVVQEITKAYMNELLDIKISSSKYNLSWLTAKADEERNMLENLEKNLQAFVRENKIITLEDKIVSTPELLSDYSIQLSQVKTKRKSLEERYLQTQQYINDYDSLERLPVFSSDLHLQQLRENILNLEQQLSEKRKLFGPKHPIIVKIIDELILLKNEKKKELQYLTEKAKNELELENKNEKNLEILLEETKTNTLIINEKLFQYNIIKRKVDTSRALFDALIQSIKEQNVTGQTKNVNVHVIEHAEVPNSPSKPQKLKNITLSIILGSLGGTLLAFFLEYFDNKIFTKEQIEQNYDTRVIGEVELSEATNVLFTNLIDTKDTFSSIAERYRTIRSAISLSSATKPIKTILITSSTKNEGKTSTCINLATTIAYSQKSVLIIDCDMRKPTLHKYLGVDNSIGLSTYLAGITQEEIIQEIPDKQISIIPSGVIPPNPSELLGSEKMKNMLNKLSDKYDYILIDSPPMLAVTDADIINTIVDGTIIIVRANSTSHDMLLTSIQKMNILKANLLGIILNGIKKSHFGISDYYYGEYRQTNDN